MKRNLTIVMSTFFMLVILQMSSLKLKSNDAQPPQAGVAGDPGETTCNNCHTGTTTVSAGVFTLKLSPDSAGLAGTANIVTASTQYIPDSTQWVSIELTGTNGNTPKYGFQLTALDTANNQAGTFTLTNTTNTSMQSSSFTGRFYVGHKAANATTTAWSFKWKAPHSGKVTFYYTGNIANGDGTDIGDDVYESSSSVTAGPVINGIADIPSNINSAMAYPVPFANNLNTELSLDKSAPLDIALISMEGRVVRELYSGQAAGGRFTRSFDMGGIASGVYYMHIRSGSSTQVIKVIKI
jgi:hypothetical protein